MNSETIVIARRWEGFQIPPDGGSAEHRCIDCGHLVLTDSISTPLIRTGLALVVCSECFVEPSGHSVQEFERDIEDAGLVGKFVEFDDEELL